MDRIKNLSFKVLDKYKSQFGENFDENKKTLDTITIIRSKGLKNEIAGFITKFIKKEKIEQKSKQAQIEAAKEEIVEQKTEPEPEPPITESSEESETTDSAELSTDSEKPAEST